MILFFGPKMNLHQTTTNNIQPIEIEASLKYRCSCGIDHWAYLREVSVEGFFIVCYCNNRLYPKTIRSISIDYLETKLPPQQPIQSLKSAPIDTDIPNDILDRCCRSMSKLGFTIKEAKESLAKAYIKQTYTNDKELIKLALLEK